LDAGAGGDAGAAADAGADEESAGAEAARSDNVTDEGGVQVARVTVGGWGYEPNNTVVYAGEPVRWILNVDGYGCAAIVDARGLGIADPLYLDPGENTAEFTLPDPGTYPYSCGMGMYTASITAVPRPSGD
jgi:plastocyanin